MADRDEHEKSDSAEHTTSQLRLGLKPNINQFLLLILVNALDAYLGDKDIIESLNGIMPAMISEVLRCQV